MAHECGPCHAAKKSDMEYFFSFSGPSEKQKCLCICFLKWLSNLRLLPQKEEPFSKLLRHHRHVELPDQVLKD
jgi:hypothetical protein